MPYFVGFMRIDPQYSAMLNRYLVFLTLTIIVSSPRNKPLN